MEEDNKYILPKVSNYIHDNELAKSISNNKSNAFISLTNEYGIKNISFNDYSNFLIYGIQRSGKSNFAENIMINILLKSNPTDSKIVIIDTKRLEYNIFNGIPHLLLPIVTDFKKANITLCKIISEIERRYLLFTEHKVKDIEKYNFMAENSKIEPLPKIYIFVDDLIDLVEYSKNEILENISLIIQKGRQVGIYIIVVTSNINVDLINIKFINLFSNKICFKAYSIRDSKLLLNKQGAEKLDEYEYYFNSLTNLYEEKYKAYKIDDSDIEKLIDYVFGQQKTQFDDRFDLETSGTAIHNDSSSDEEYDDPLYKDIVEFVIKTGKASASLLQRKFKLGYNRAARIIDLLEERGIISPQNGDKPRDVLVKLEETDISMEKEIIKEETNVSLAKEYETDIDLKAKKIFWIIIVIMAVFAILMALLAN